MIGVLQVPPEAGLVTAARNNTSLEEKGNMNLKVANMSCLAVAVILLLASTVTAQEQGEPAPKAQPETPTQPAIPESQPEAEAQPATPPAADAQAKPEEKAQDTEPAATESPEPPLASPQPVQKPAIGQETPPGKKPAAIAKKPQETTDLKEIKVYGTAITAPTKETNDTVYTGTEVTREGMEIAGSKGAVSVYNTVDVVPGLSVEKADGYGLDVEQRNVRFRGVRSSMGSITVEGVPNWGGNPIGPRDYLYDSENMESVAVYKGAVPSDLGTGTGGRGGVIELRPRWPQLKPGGEIGMGLGLYDYFRGYYRLDSGVLPLTDTSASISYSYTNADKWKGPGTLGPRNNANFMLRQPAWGKDEVKAWLNFNDLEQDLYRLFSYEETRDLDANYENDYRARLTGRREQDIYYYRNNRSLLTNVDALAMVPVTIDNTYQLSFKPYISMEDSNILGGSEAQGSMVSKRLRDFLRVGLISEIHAGFTPGDLMLQAVLGYLIEGSDLSVNTKNYHPSTFEYLGWGNYSKSDDIGIQHSPYLKVAAELSDLSVQAGVKYFYYADPSSTGFRYNRQNEQLDRDPCMDREARSYDGIFPSFGAGYQFLPELNLYGSYGRNFVRPYSYQPLLRLYNQYPDRFESAGVTLNDMFEGYTMETSDNFDLGARLTTEWFALSPTFFISLHRNLLTSVYDSRVDLNYNQNVGKSTGYGFELEANLFIGDVVTLFVNPTYTHLTYDEDLVVQGNPIEIKDNQVVDTPQWLLKTGVMFAYQGWEATLVGKYLSERFGDIEHQEKIDGHFVTDAGLSYTFHDAPIAQQLKFALEIQNLFDTRYVSVITSSDYNRAGSTGYRVGAPFTAMLKASAEL
jgi:iron complex outermembrane receptor protein